MEGDSIRRVGILGGGQLARMLAEAATGLGIEAVVYAEDPGAPACLVAPRKVIGSLRDEAALRRLFTSVDAVIFENEFVDVQLLASAADGRETLFRPSLRTLEVLQDKTGQKRVLAAAGAPLTRWFERAADEAPEAFVERALDLFGGRAVLKWARFGYDGKGVLVATPANRTGAAEFCHRAGEAGVTLFAEEFVEFRNELAMVATRGAAGECVTYPLVISEQERSICRLVHGPATSEGVDASYEAHAAQIVRAVGAEAKLVGTYAIEFFQAHDGRLLVNEIAPRVHNSGHYTLDACETSQFANHLRGALGLPLGDPRPRGAFAMLNILGPDGVTRPNRETPPPRSRGEARVYWYEKEQIMPWRKLGHVNAVADDPAKLPALIDALRAVDDEWRATLAAGAAR